MIVSSLEWLRRQTATPSVELLFDRVTLGGSRSDAVSGTCLFRRKSCERCIYFGYYSAVFLGRVAMCRCDKG